MFGNMGKMLQMVGELKTKLPEMKERLANSTYAAEVGEGAVSATVSGKMELVDLRIDVEKVTVDGRLDKTMLEDYVKAGVSAAQAQAAQAAKEALAELTGGMDIPGLTDMM